MRTPRPPSVGTSNPRQTSRLATYCTLSIGACTLATSDSQAQFVSINITSAGSSSANISGPNAGLISGSNLLVPDFAGSGSGSLILVNQSPAIGLAGLYGLSFSATSGYCTPKNFAYGASIDNSSPFFGSISYGVSYESVFAVGVSSSSNFGANSFMGFRFGSSGNYNYGWIEVTWSNSTSTFQILSAGYEATVNTPILAGVSATPVPETSSAYPLALALGGVAVRQYRKRRKQQAASCAEAAVVTAPLS